MEIKSRCSSGFDWSNVPYAHCSSRKEHAHDGSGAGAGNSGG